MSTPPTVADYLRGLGVTNPAHLGLLGHVTDQYRAAHLGRHNIDPGDQVPDVRLADRVMDLTTVTICRHCEEVQPEDVDPDAMEPTCDRCGRGTAADPAWVLVPSWPLPIALGATEDVGCVDCGRTFPAAGYRVERRLNAVQVGAVCPDCARAVPETAAWQGVCDLAAGIDEVMQRATDAAQRELLAAKLAQIAHHFAGWRWPGEQPKP
ncbi:hypothetical protein [Micromonospora rubida]